MTRFLRLTVLALLFAFVTESRAHIAADEMMEAAKEFLDSLKPEQKQKAVFAMSSGERTNWAFVPKERKGIPFKDLTKEQRGLVHGLLDAALSQRGYVKATTIMSLETILHELENKSPRRDPELYYITIFGEPAAQGTWGWRFEGHHLSINFTIVNNTAIACAPHFFGSNPGEIQAGARKGTRALAQEEEVARQLVNLLDEEQKKTAVFAREAPAEIITKNDRRASPIEPQGLPFSEMNREQGELLLKVVREFVYRYRDEIADDEWRKINRAGLDGIYFAWAGGFERGQKHYYRVQGPTFLLEYDNTQNNANHVHTTWRDFENDFGDDILRKHYDEVEHPEPKLERPLGNNPAEKKPADAKVPPAERRTDPEPLTKPL